MRCPKCNFDDFLKANGIELLPFQKEVLEKISKGEKFMFCIRQCSAEQIRNFSFKHCLKILTEMKRRINND